MKYSSRITIAVLLCCALLGIGYFLNSERDRESGGRNEDADEEEGREHNGEEGEEEGEEFDNPGMFVEVHREMRTPEDRQSPAYLPGYKMTELLKAGKLNARKTRTGRTQDEVTWTERGPGNVPGRTRALLNIKNASNNLWLAGAATGGIWKTEDGGTSWSEKNDNLTILPISSFATDESQSIIYAGTGEFVSTLFSAMGDGIFVSSDKGNTWSILPSTQGNNDFAIVTRIVVDPSNPQIVVATTVPSTLSEDVTSAIMRSTNGGISWTKVKEVTGVFEQIIATPGNFSVQYASQNGVGVWKSTNAGVSWTLSNAGMIPAGRLELAVSPVNPNNIFASSEGTFSGTESDLYFSSNAGATWGLVEMKFDGTIVDFLGNSPTEADSQGFYDNTILCDPFNENIIYVGGVNLFKATVGNTSGTFQTFQLAESNTESFLVLQSFSNIGFDKGRLTVGPNADGTTVEIRFGPGLKQFAHRFLVPENKTSGVAVTEYTYASYVEVPFQVWDVDANRQLMVSFRDQNRNNVFDLVEQFLTSDGSDYLLNSREYLYINNVNYSTTPNPLIMATGGIENRLMYNLFPALRSGVTWNPNALPSSKVTIKSLEIQKHLSTTVTAADAYGNFDGKNPANQTNLNNGVHPDHHFMTAVVTDVANQKYKILLGNDGGVFVSDESTTPGTTSNVWQFKGFGYNTSQFYGADKRPGKDQYFGGMQDNGTRISPVSGTANAQTAYDFAIAGDGFEVLWNSRDEKLLLGTVYNGSIYRSTDGGSEFNTSTSGISESSTFPFFTKLANSKDFPGRVFTVASDGVYRSINFGSTWKLTAIGDNFITNSTSLLDVEVSRANPNIVWAGSGMSNLANQERNLFVSIDGGLSYSATTNFNSVVLGSITKLASHPFEPNTAYALFSFADKPKVLKTKNLGQSWEDISGFGSGSSSTNGFPDVATFCLYVRPDNPSILWAGTEIGIVESTDDGATWALVADFPKVAVWDIKGQDNQVVISTHGRGIWTGTLAAPQSDFVKQPAISKTGIAPSGALAIRITSEVDFDSVQIYVDKTLKQTLKPVAAGNTDAFVKGLSKASHTIYLQSFKDGVPLLSKTVTETVINVAAVKNSFSTSFNNTNDFLNNGLNLLPIQSNGSKKTLRTPSPYKDNTSYSTRLLVPVKVNATLPTLYYKDVAIIEPAHDYAVLQSTKNGLDWIELLPKYDADFDPAWKTAYVNGDTAKQSMLIMHEIDLSTFYATGDTLLFQWKMESDAQNHGWGWALSYVAIQELPVGNEPVIVVKKISLFPNPATDKVTLQFQLLRQSAVDISLLNLAGKRMINRSFGKRQAGVYEEDLVLTNYPNGVYIVQLKTNGGVQNRKLVVNR